MKIKIRTVKNAVCDVEVNSDQTIAEVKKAIETTYNHPVASQRLIFAGKVLDDANTVASYNIEENKLVVLYIKDPAPAPAAPAATATPATPATPANTTTTQAPSTPAQPTTTAPRTEVQTPTSPTAATTNAEFDANVQAIVDMGFDRSQAIRALNAAFGDSARAVEYIVSGNIPNINAGGMPRAPASANTEPTSESDGEGEGVNAAGAFAALRQLPQFQGIIALIQQDPSLLEPLLQQLAQRDPSIVDLIRENKEEFLEILQQPVDPNMLNALRAGAGYEEDGEDDEDYGDLGEGGMQNPPPGANYIQITPQEKEAIDRLCALGFDRNRVLEAFLACDRDEEMAANYLLEHMDE